jgi:predicted DNA-binding protein
MSRTVSFRASEELDEYLEQEAERRLTTKSTVVQMIVAEHFQEVKEEQQEDGSEEEQIANSANRSEDAPREEFSGDDDSEEEEAEQDALDRNPDVWYMSSGEKDYAVYVPEGADTTDAGKRRYYATRSGAAKGVKRWYE